MCGIVGIYFKKKKLHNKLGKYLSGMLDNMSSRGPDSAGFAIYNNDTKKFYKYSLCINDKSIINEFEVDIKNKFKDLTIKSVSDHLVIQTLSSPKTIAENHFWLSLGDSDILLWAQGVAINSELNVTIREPDVSPLQLQGPKSIDIMKVLFGDQIVNMKYYWLIETKLNGNDFKTHLEVFATEHKSLHTNHIIQVYAVSQSWEMGTGKLQEPVANRFSGRGTNNQTRGAHLYIFHFHHILHV